MRLIDAERLCENCKDFPQCKGEFKAECAAYVEVAAQPTIAPASLRPKGEWIYNTDDFTPKKRCTNCGYNKPLVAGEAIKQEPDNFCPNCGADMRGETHDS